MKISKQELIELNACEDGLTRFIEQTNGTDEPVDVVSLIGGVNTIEDLLWLAGECLDKKDILVFTIKCAQLVSHLNDNPRVQTAIDAAQSWVDNPCEETRQAAADAADAAVYADTAAESKNKINEYLKELFTSEEK